MIRRDVKKLKALTHYVCWKCENPAILGATKLNKALWVSDLWWYVRTGAPITGETYVKRQYGPVPSSILTILGDLEREGAIVTRERRYDGFNKRDFIALTEPDISMFTPEEISVIDKAIDFVCHRHTAKSISRRTHDDIWKIAEIGEEIPYHAMLASVLGEVMPEDVDWARRLEEVAA
ncbi:MAG: SocA family protein [Gemmatimonadales bacterium]|nr:SocA family protein [Gemmatimonadales bacterium]MCB9518440.1 SocA family protein [Gemmatimonadales bacterium]